METTVERRVDPRNMPFHIKLADAPTISVQVDAYSARRRVNGWLASAVGGLLLADTPTLTLELGHPHWSVPVLLTSSSGPRGVVGWVDVDAHSGEFERNPASARAILVAALKLLGKSDEEIVEALRVWQGDGLDEKQPHA